MTTPDEVLRDWGDRLYYPSVRGRKGRNIKGGPPPPPRAPKPARHDALTMRAQVSRTADRAPEVMVKISGGGRNMGHIKAHLDYISRNGDVELEDEQGNLLRGVEDLRDVKDAWAYGRIGISADGDRRREAFNIILSMPPGTDRKAVKDAARQFASEEFGAHQYVFAAHDDEKHPHVHLAVKAVDSSGYRLNPRKHDLQAWRERFAEKLREQGVVANATPRRARGALKTSQKQAVRWIDKEHEAGRRGSPSKVEQARAQRREREYLGADFRVALGKARRDTVSAYAHMARALAKSSQLEDRQLALQLVGFVRDMPPISPEGVAVVTGADRPHVRSRKNEKGAKIAPQRSSEKPNER